MTNIRPSKMHRLERCPGSARLEEKYGTGETSAAAEIGTELHAKVTEGILNDSARRGILVSLSDHESAMVGQCFDEFDAIMKSLSPEQRERARIFCEEEINLTALGMEKHKADLVVYVPETDTGTGLVYVRDWKFGFTYVPPAKWNLQIQCYAWGIALKFEITSGVVNVGIVQPAIYDYTDAAEMDADFIKVFQGRIDGIIERCKSQNAPVISGPWCLFCGAKGRCETRALVAAEVSALSNPVESIKGLSPAARTEYYERLKAAIGIMEDAKDEINMAIISGAFQIPGYEAGEGRKTRSWAMSNAEAIARLQAEASKLGLGLSDISAPVSVKKAEDLLGEKAISGMVLVTPGNPTVKKIKKGKK